MLLSLALLSQYRFNRVRLTENDFYQLCHERDVTVLELDVSTSFYFWVLGKEFIVIDKKLTGLAREFAMWHELAHCYLSSQIERPAVHFQGLVHSKEETEADAFACIALIPLPLIDDYSFVQDCCCGMAKWIFEKRRKIYELYKLCPIFLASSFFL